MSEEKESRLSDAELTPGVPTAWQLPGGAWVLGILLDGIPCYFVGGPFPSVSGAFASFWVAAAVAARLLGEEWARHLAFKELAWAQLAPHHMPGLRDGWWIGAVSAHGEVQGFVAVSPTGPLQDLYDTADDAWEGAKVAGGAPEQGFARGR